MNLTPDTLIYMITTICTFVLGIGVGAHIENRRIKKTDIENLIRKNMLSNIYLYENLNIPIEVIIKKEIEPRDITQELPQTY